MKPFEVKYISSLRSENYMRIHVIIQSISKSKTNKETNTPLQSGWLGWSYALSKNKTAIFLAS